MIFVTDVFDHMFTFPTDSTGATLIPPIFKPKGIFLNLICIDSLCFVCLRLILLDPCSQPHVFSWLIAWSTDCVDYDEGCLFDGVFSFCRPASRPAA